MAPTKGHTKVTKIYPEQFINNIIHSWTLTWENFSTIYIYINIVTNFTTVLLQRVKERRTETLRGLFILTNKLYSGKINIYFAWNIERKVFVEKTQQVKFVYMSILLEQHFYARRISNFKYQDQKLLSKSKLQNILKNIEFIFNTSTYSICYKT